MKQFQIIADEGWTHKDNPPNRYHHFYAAIAGPTETLDKLQNLLLHAQSQFKHRHKNELKWSRLNGRFFHDYKLLIDTFFDFWEEHDDLKFRQLFMDRRYEYTGDNHEKESLFMVYYQFLKHAFGLNTDHFKQLDAESIIFKLDDYPDRQRKITFTDYVESLYQDYSVKVRFIDSKKSIILQVVDLLMGAAGYFGNYKCCKTAGPVKQQDLCKTKFAKYIRDRLEAIEAADRGTKAFSWFNSTGCIKGLSKDNSYLYKILIWRFIPGEHRVNSEWTNKHSDVDKYKARQKYILKKTDSNCDLFD